MSTQAKDLIQEVKDAITIGQVAQMLSLPLKSEGDGYRTACPVHAAGHRRSLGVYPNVRRKDGTLGSFTCFSAPVTNSKERFCTGDSVGLYSHIRGCNNYEAAKAIAAHYGVGTLPTTSAKPREMREDPPVTARPRQTFDTEKYLKELDPEHPALQHLEVSADTLREFKAGYCAKGRRHLNRLAIAMCDMDGHAFGFMGIALDEHQEPYIKLPYDDYDPRPYIFGADKVEPGHVDVVRDPLAVLEAYERGDRNIVAVLTEIDGLMQPTVEALAIFMSEKKVTSISMLF